MIEKEKCIPYIFLKAVQNIFLSNIKSPKCIKECIECKEWSPRQGSLFKVESIIFNFYKTMLSVQLFCLIFEGGLRESPALKHSRTCWDSADLFLKAGFSSTHFGHQLEGFNFFSSIHFHKCVPFIILIKICFTIKVKLVSILSFVVYFNQKMDALHLIRWFKGC